jgi:hypothetical protein
MRIIETKVYTIDEHPNKQKCFDWIRDNWHDLSQFHIDEIINTMKAIQNLIGGEIQYSISAVGDRGEFISWKDYDKKALKNIKGEELPISGICYEHDIIEALKNDKLESILYIIHNETEYIYSDNALEEMCLSNEYEFKENGAIA